MGLGLCHYGEHHGDAETQLNIGGQVSVKRLSLPHPEQNLRERLLAEQAAPQPQ